jgi:Reverse transcriptase (RNA-dependent DNA polymerase)/Endonuclease-reverse transcriptase
MATWNIRGLAGKEAELVDEFEKERLDILGITETKKKGMGEMEINKGHLMIFNGVEETRRAKGGVGCIINKEYRKFITRWEGITERILRIELKLLEATTIIVVYGPNEDEKAAEKDEFWKKLNETVENVKDRMIIIGDFNGRVGKRDEESSDVIGVQGENTRNRNGVRLINFCILNQLIVTNTFYQHKDIHKYTREVKSRGERSIIDYVIVNRENRREVIDVRVYRGAEIYSDHFLVIAKIKMKLIKYKGADKTGPRKQKKKSIKVYKLREKEIAEKYKNQTEKEIYEKKNTIRYSTTEEMWEILKTTILKAAADVCGITITGGNKKRTKWWNVNIQEQVKVKKQKWKEYLKEKTAESYEIYKNQRKCVKDLVMKAKEEEWEEFGEKLEKDSKGNQKLFFRVIKTLRKQKISNALQIKNKQGDIKRGDKEIMDRWREYFEELLNVENTQEVDEIDEDILDEKQEEMEEERITTEEVKDAVKQLKRGKAAGYDSITAEMLQNLGKAGLEFLTELYNKIWREETIPKDWEIGIVIPLFKKGDNTDCNNYRGITLLSSVLKVYERILEQRLRKIIENQLDETQSGFRKGRSAQDHIFTVKQIIEKKQLEKEKVYMAFIDIQKAFDSVPRRLIWKSLQQRGVGNRLRNNIKSIYQTTRNYVRKDNKQSEEFITKDGLRQGGVLSPVLFIMIMDDVLKEIKTSSKNIQVGYRNLEMITIAECLFADDLVLFAKNEKDLKQNIMAWRNALKKRNMNINVEKTNIMVIGEEEQDTQIDMEIDEVKVKQVQNFKYLGVQIQSNGKQDAEINERISAASKVYHALNKNFLGMKQISRNTKLKVYKAIFCPILTYGSESWILTQNIKSRLQATEMKYLRRVKGITRRDRVRNEAVREELNVEPIMTKIKIQQLKWFGHLTRMHKNRPVKKVWQARPMKRRARGRPRKTWENTIIETLQDRNITWREACSKAQNKGEWAKFVYK